MGMGTRSARRLAKDILIEGQQLNSLEVAVSASQRPYCPSLFQGSSQLTVLCMVATEKCMKS